MQRTNSARRGRPFLSALLFLAAVAVLLSRSGVASAAPEVHILRIDPRAGVANGAPLLTTVVELVEFKSLSDAMRPCANSTGFAPTSDCISGQLENPANLFTPLKFPQGRERLLVKVAGADTLASLEGAPVKWRDAKNQPGVGTAWLVALDAAASMASRYQEARVIARQFVEAMGPNDLMNIQIFDDRMVIQNSGWKTAAKADRDALVSTLNSQPGTAVSHGPNRALFDTLKGLTSDSFSQLGNIGGPQNIPLHQAMVVLSNGAGRNDASSAAPSAALFHQFVTKGRFPEDNTSAPKTPLPVISVWLPQGGGLMNDVYRNNDQQFMQSLANPEIGGFFDIVRDGQGAAKGKAILGAVNKRFDEMYIAKWRLSCLNPSVAQTFDLEFPGTSPQLKGDASFADVPIGVDPSQWPLDIDVAKTKAQAEADPVHPGGTMKIYGNFCWSGDSKRAEAYFIPAGSKPDPNVSSSDLAAVKRAQQNLIAQNLHASATEANDSFATFSVPDEETMLDGSGDNAVVRVLVYDNVAHRASGHDEKTILTLKGSKKPFNLLLILGITGGVVVILLLVVVLLRGGGGKGKRGRGAPPAPVGPQGGGGGYVPPGPGYGGQPQGPYTPPGPGGGYPPQGGGYAAPMDAYAAPPAPPVAIPAFVASAPGAAVGAQAAVVQVQCPACQALTMATPGQPAVCFSCGQPLPAGFAGGGGALEASTFPAHRWNAGAAGRASAQSLRELGSHHLG